MGLVLFKNRETSCRIDNWKIPYLKPLFTTTKNLSVCKLIVYLKTCTSRPNRELLYSISFWRKEKKTSFFSQEGEITTIYGTCRAIGSDRLVEDATSHTLPRSWLAFCCRPSVLFYVLCTVYMYICIVYMYICTLYNAHCTMYVLLSLTPYKSKSTLSIMSVTVLWSVEISSYSSGRRIDDLS